MTLLTQSSYRTVTGSPVVFDPQAAVKAEFGRLMHAAIINRTFRQKLLADPSRSIEDGYCGEKFHFPPELKERIQLIRAESLECLSLQIMQIIDSPYISEKVILHF